MELHSLQTAKGATKNRKRIGRGQGSGRGGTSTKGHKGQKSRSGYSYRAWFEGGQMPYVRKLPKRGFNNFTRKEILPVNLDALNAFDEGAEITIEVLKDKRAMC